MADRFLSWETPDAIAAERLEEQARDRLYVEPDRACDGCGCLLDHGSWCDRCGDGL